MNGRVGTGLRRDIAQRTGIESGKYLDEMLGRFLKDLMATGMVLGYQKDLSHIS